MTFSRLLAEILTGSEEEPRPLVLPPPPNVGDETESLARPAVE